MTAPAMTTSELLDRLRRHYIVPGANPAGGIFLPEVTHTDVAYSGRRVDALYVGFMSSKGHHLVGHELKVSRSDWLHELAQIDKSDVWASQCHAFYLVVPDAAIIQDGELPPDWGLMVVDPKTKTRLAVKKVAHLHRDRQPSWVTVHSILKRIDTLHTQALHTANTEGSAGMVAAAVAQTKKDLRWEIQRAEEKRDEALAAVKLIEQELGLELSEYRWTLAGMGKDHPVLPAHAVGPAFAQFALGHATVGERFDRDRGQISHVAETLTTIAKNLTEVMAYMQKDPDA